MLVRVELAKGSFSDKINDLMQIRQKVEHRLRNSLNVNASVELVEPGSLPRFEGKAKRVIDKRSL
jgi:phenylacetate-CoA ligase